MVMHVTSKSPCSAVSLSEQNQSCTYLVAVCPVSCCMYVLVVVCPSILLAICPLSCWPKFHSIFNGLQCIATGDEKHYQCQNIVLNNKTGPLFFQFNWWIIVFDTGHGLSIKKVSLVRTPTSVTKMISRNYKFHVLKRRIADFFERSEIFFGQIQF